MTESTSALATLADDLVALIGIINEELARVAVFTNEQINLYTSTDPTVLVTGEDGDPVVLPSYLSLVAGSGGGDLSVIQAELNALTIQMAGITTSVNNIGNVVSAFGNTVSALQTALGIDETAITTAQSSADLAQTTADLAQSTANSALALATTAIQSVNGKTTTHVTLYTDDIAEFGTPTNLWFTQARVLATQLSTVDTSHATAISAGDSLQVAAGKLQAQISAGVVSVAGLTGVITAGALKSALAITTSDVSGLGTAAELDVDTDVLLTASSNLKVPSQHAVKVYVDNVIADAGGLASVQAGDFIAVDNTDPGNPIVSSTLGLTTFFPNGDSVTLRRGQPVYLDSTGSWQRATSDPSKCWAIGLLYDDDVAVGSTARAQIEGVMAQPVLEWNEVTGTTGGLAPRMPYFAVADGTMLFSPPETPGEMIVRLGMALSSTEFMIKPFNPIQL